MDAKIGSIPAVGPLVSKYRIHVDYLWSFVDGSFVFAEQSDLAWTINVTTKPTANFQTANSHWNSA